MASRSPGQTGSPDSRAGGAPKRPARNHIAEDEDIIMSEELMQSVDMDDMSLDIIELSIDE